jgi:lysophospholipase L1-like esterase
LSILVLGDSYSAGNGAGEYFGAKGCRRSHKNYAEDFARLVQAAPYHQPASSVNAACSGATTSWFFNSHHGRPPELDAVNRRYDLIFLTVGGNDVKFAGLVADCLVNKTNKGSKCLKDLHSALRFLTDGTIKQSVTTVLKAIGGRAGPHAKIVLLGYPYLEGDRTYELIDRGEGSGSLGHDPCGIRRGRTNFVTVGRCLYRVEDLGQNIQRGIVEQLNAIDHKHRFVFVSTQRLFAGTQPGFKGPNHELFATHVNPNRWFIQPFVDADSGLGTIEAPFGGDNVFYHPNATGWEEEAQLLLSARGVPQHPPAGGSGQSSVYILTISGPIAGGGHLAEARPRDIKLYSGAYLEHLRWSAWGASTARATGDEVDVDKTTSPYRSLTNPVQVRAYSLRRCGTKRVYRELSVHFTKDVPPGLGLSRDSTYSMSCPD